MNGRSATLGLSALAVATVVFVSLYWGLQHAALSNPAVLGRIAPRLAIQTASGEQVKVWELRGKPVVLNFWASWCAPCVAESAVLAAAVSANPGVAFVGADNRDSTAGFMSFERRHPHPYPAGPIVTGSYQAYGVAGLPETFFIDAQGVIVASFTGPLDSPTLDHYLGLVTS